MISANIMLDNKLDLLLRHTSTGSVVGGFCESFCGNRDCWNVDNVGEGEGGRWGFSFTLRWFIDEALSGDILCKVLQNVIFNGRFDF